MFLFYMVHGFVPLVQKLLYIMFTNRVSRRRNSSFLVMLVNCSNGHGKEPLPFDDGARNYCGHTAWFV
jgi:hypothetical protein